MRKHTKRKFVPPRIDRSQYNGLLIKARLGLEKIRVGSGSVNDWVCVLGILHVGIAFAYLMNNQAFILEGRRVMKTWMEIEPDEHDTFILPEGEEGALVLALFNAIDDFLKKAHVTRINEALTFVRQAIEGTRECPDIASVTELKRRLYESQQAA